MGKEGHQTSNRSTSQRKEKKKSGGNCEETMNCKSGSNKVENKKTSKCHCDASSKSSRSVSPQKLDKCSPKSTSSARATGSADKTTKTKSSKKVGPVPESGDVPEIRCPQTNAKVFGCIFYCGKHGKEQKKGTSDDKVIDRKVKQKAEGTEQPPGSSSNIGGSNKPSGKATSREGASSGSGKPGCESGCKEKSTQAKLTKHSEKTSKKQEKQTPGSDPEKVCASRPEKTASSRKGENCSKDREKTATSRQGTGTVTQEGKGKSHGEKTASGRSGESASSRRAKKCLPSPERSDTNGSTKTLYKVEITGTTKEHPDFVVKVSAKPSK